MLPSDYRLRRRGEFAAAIRTGVRVRRDGVVVHLAHRSTTDPSAASAVPSDSAVRCGFVVAGAVGTAVVRNKVRRRLRHLLRARLHDLPGGCDIVIRVDRGAVARSYDELGGDLMTALAAAAARLNAANTGGRRMTRSRAR